MLGARLRAGARLGVARRLALDVFFFFFFWPPPPLILMLADLATICGMVSPSAYGFFVRGFT